MPLPTTDALIVKPTNYKRLEFKWTVIQDAAAQELALSIPKEFVGAGKCGMVKKCVCQNSGVTV